MDMTLSKRGDYVMRSAISLARVYDRDITRKIREVVADTEVPPTFAAQILTDLVRAGLAYSKAGRTGGYRLARPPADISVLEVIEAAEGPLRAERCALGEGPCRWSAVCPLHETWSAATAALRDLLAQTTLAEVVARDLALEAGTYPVPPDSHRTHPTAIELADIVQVELAAPDAQSALHHLGSDLAHLIADSTGDDPGGAPPTQRRPATSVEASLIPEDLSGTNTVKGGTQQEASTSYLLSWRRHSPEPISWLEAHLTVTPVDAQRCEIKVEGTWHEQPDTTGPPANLDHRARRSLRLFLRALAHTIEEPPHGRNASAHAPASSGRRSANRLVDQAR